VILKAAATTAKAEKERERKRSVRQQHCQAALHLNREPPVYKKQRSKAHHCHEEEEEVLP
jgi:hypothetical protein